MKYQTKDHHLAKKKRGGEDLRMPRSRMQSSHANFTSPGFVILKTPSLTSTCLLPFHILLTFLDEFITATSIAKLSLPPCRLVVLIAILIMAAQLPPFVQRLFRPFTSSTRLSLNPEAPAQIPAGSQKCTVAAGCFWGVEHLFRKHFEGKGLIDAKVGYIGGDINNPGYRAVCSGRTGRGFFIQAPVFPKVLNNSVLQTPKPSR